MITIMHVLTLALGYTFIIPTLQLVRYRLRRHLNAKLNEEPPKYEWGEVISDVIGVWSVLTVLVIMSKMK